MIRKIINKVRGIADEPLKKLDDEYLNWLTFANAGMLNPGNVYCMDYAIARIQSDNPLLEIGSFCGLSTNIMSYLLRKHSKTNKIITSDKWIFEGAESGGTLGHSPILHSQYRSFVMESFKRNVAFFGDTSSVHPIEAFSDEFFELCGERKVVSDLFGAKLRLGGNFSFAYIDGNHTYEYAKRDFVNTSKFLDIGGFILFDDSSKYSPWGCALLMKEIMDASDYELVMTNPNYLFKKVN